MSEGKHTPLPWRAEPNGWTPWDGAIGILPVGKDEDHAIAWTTSGDNEEANASLICRAVNNHDALVRALEHVTELLVDTWSTAMEGDPEKEIAVADARALLEAASKAEVQS
jgi:hypothetical protein